MREPGSHSRACPRPRGWARADRSGVVRGHGRLRGSHRRDRWVALQAQVAPRTGPGAELRAEARAPATRASDPTHYRSWAVSAAQSKARYSSFHPPGCAAERVLLSVRSRGQGRGSTSHLPARRNRRSSRRHAPRTTSHCHDALERLVRAATPRKQAVAGATRNPEGNVRAARQEWKETSVRTPFLGRRSRLLRNL